jgi:glycosyltransferase involved in cell wall biosynthesis
MISIITPLLNGEKYIIETFLSIKKNKFIKEWIIVDGGSTDRSINILSSLNSKIIKIYKKKGNSSIGINYGIKMAKFNIIGVIGCDDLYSENTSKLVVETFKKNPNIKWCIGQSTIINEENIEISQIIKIYKNYKLNRYSYKSLTFENYISTMSVFWKKEIHNIVGYWNENIIHCNDYDMWLRFASRYNPYILNKNLSFFRVHKNSHSQKKIMETLSESYKISVKYINKNNFFIKFYLKIKILFFVFSSKLVWLINKFIIWKIIYKKF